MTPIYVSSCDCWDSWSESKDGTDLAPGEWEGTGGTSYAQCQDRAKAAHSMYFAWTGEVYQPGYCKVLKSGVLSPNLNTHQGYGYKLYDNTCHQIESEVGGKEDCKSPPESTCELCEGVYDYCSDQKYVVKTYPLEDAQHSGLFGCTYPMTPIYVSSCDCWDSWSESKDGTDLAPGEWEGTGGTSYAQCQDRAKAAHSMYFAWTGEVYQPGYCKVLKSGVLSPNLNTHQGYGYKLYDNTCHQIGVESKVGQPRHAEAEEAIGTIGQVNHINLFFAMIGALTLIGHGANFLHKKFFTNSEFKIIDEEC